MARRESPYWAAVKVLGSIASAVYFGAKVVRVAKASRGEKCPDCDKLIAVLDSVYEFCPRCKGLFLI